MSARAARLPLVLKVVVVIASVKFSYLENIVLLSAGVKTYQAALGPI